MIIGSLPAQKPGFGIADGLTRRVEERAVISLQIHTNPKVVKIIGSENLNFFASLRCFDHDAYGKLLPGDAQKPFAPLTD
jgi:hypothetical protein